MNVKLLVCMSAFILPATAAYSQEGKVTIMSPMAGAMLIGSDTHQLQYEVMPGPNGDHVHVYVDDKEKGVLRSLKGSYPLEGLAPGNRSICIKVVNKAHTPIGIEGCVKVSVATAPDGRMQAPPKSGSSGY